jgi:hypothetical protein
VCDARLISQPSPASRFDSQRHLSREARPPSPRKPPPRCFRKTLQQTMHIRKICLRASRKRRSETPKTPGKEK